MAAKPVIGINMDFRAGFLIHSEMLDDPIVATDVIQRILGRAIGPEGRRLIPQA